MYNNPQHQGYSDRSVENHLETLSPDCGGFSKPSEVILTLGPLLVRQTLPLVSGAAALRKFYGQKAEIMDQIAESLAASKTEL